MIEGCKVTARHYCFPLHLRQSMNVPQTARLPHPANENAAVSSKSLSLADTFSFIIAGLSSRISTDLVFIPITASPSHSHSQHSSPAPSDLEKPSLQHPHSWCTFFIHRPPRRARTRCNVAPPSRLYSSAVLSSFLQFHVSCGIASRENRRRHTFAFLRRLNAVGLVECLLFLRLVPLCGRPEVCGLLDSFLRLIGVGGGKYGSGGIV